MGLLDDAIREHLELKRQHGGDPSEIERLEREALGAPGRTTEPAGDEAAAPDAAHETPAPAASAEPEPVAAAPEAPAETPPPTEDHVIGPGPEEAADAPIEADDASIEEEALTEIVPPAEPAPRDGADWMADDAPAEADPAAAPDEDVLEETPEFLQETPEHDRLWFEQKPPRDFDWDR
jgi:hypothetical protein